MEIINITSKRIKISILCFFIGFVIGFTKNGIPFPAIREAITLATTRKPETFTELYFEDHTNLPKTLTLETDQTFKFTLHNLEYRDMTYTYELNAIDDIQTMTLSSGSIVLPHDAYQTIDGTYTPATDSGRVKIQVILPEKNQSIGFWMEGKNENQ